MDNSTIGYTLIDRGILGTLPALWEGPLESDLLPAIEMGIRAFIVGDKLCAGQHTALTPNLSGRINGTRIPGGLAHQQAFASTTPFGDHLLDYEFIEATEAPFIVTPDNEISAIHERIFQLCVRAYTKVFPSSELYSEKYINDEDDIAESLLGEMGYPYEAYWNMNMHHGPASDFGCFQTMTVDYAQYLLDCHYSRYTVFAENRIADICHKHVFSLWPRMLFESFSEQYKNEARELRQPGASVDLPPFLALLMSRSSSRSAIPQTLVHMRQEYSQSRVLLWRMLRQMWESDTKKEQRDVLAALTAAKDSLFMASKSTSLERVNALDIAVGLATSPAKLADSLRQSDAPNVGVTAVSLAKQLSSDFRKNLLSDQANLKRLLTRSEIEALHKS